MRVITCKDDWNVYSNDVIQQKFSVNSHIGQSLIDQFELRGQVEATQIKEGNFFIFEECPPISSYIYALTAGPYHEFENASGFKVPMKIMCRQSKIQNADA